MAYTVPINHQERGDTIMEAFLHHGTGTQGPFSTEAVDIKEAPLSRSTVGYGSRIPTAYMIRAREHGARWRRVYAECWPNRHTFYINGFRGESARVIVQIYE